MSTLLSAKQLISVLGLAPHPEGGYFVETFRSELRVRGETHPGAERSASTAIYFLLETHDFSALHRVRSDEVWHHYAGDPLELTLLFPDGAGRQVVLSPDFATNQRPQFVVPAGVFQAARPRSGPAGYTLCGCTVAPGFEFRDFEMPDRDTLIRSFPPHSAWISALTRR